jgi:hypothetical protein
MARRPEHGARPWRALSSDDPGKIERWHQTLKNRILLENYYRRAISKPRSRLSSLTTIACARNPSRVQVVDRHARITPGLPARPS